MKIFDYVILATGLGELLTVACSTRQGLRVAVLENTTCLVDAATCLTAFR